MGVICAAVSALVMGAADSAGALDASACAARALRVVRRAADLAGAASAGVVSEAAAALVVRRRVVVVFGCSVVWALMASSWETAALAVVALRRVRVARRGCACSPVVGASAEIGEVAVACAEVSAPVGAVAFRVRVVRRGGKVLS